LAALAAWNHDFVVNCPILVSTILLAVSLIGYAAFVVQTAGAAALDELERKLSGPKHGSYLPKKRCSLKACTP
jgi:hypothetical protein